MSAAMSPVQIGTLTLRNRFLKTATYEGCTPAGEVTEGLVAHHRGMAEAGVALTTVAYGAVSDRGRTFSDQLCLPRARGLDRLTQAVHDAGGAISLQLAHCGGFSKNRQAGTPLAPSAGWNPYGIAYGLPRTRAMDATDLAATRKEFADAADLAVQAGFDALELHLGHGYLLSQFLSPLMNHRTDAYGGALSNRLRFPLEVVDSIRQRLPTVPLLAKINLDDGVRGGASVEDALQIAQALQAAGVDALVPSGGLVQRSAFYLMRGDTPLAEMAANESSWLQRISMRSFGAALVRSYPYSSSFFLDKAARLVDRVDIPVGLLGGVDSSAAVDHALQRGFGFVVMGRALLADPDFIARHAAGQSVVTRCTHCNLCVARMNGGVRCHL